MHSQKQVLIVDDEAFIRVLLVQAMEDLKSEGVELLTAADGAIALEMIERHEPDLIFLDVMMPNVSGYEVCRRVKEEYDDVYVIMLTAKGQRIDREKGEALGADEYITKPFDPDYLLKRAAQVLELEVVP
jgi:two-component system, OmpR family, alkaline phosphatase synthesis response regulator PhoP